MFAKVDRIIQYNNIFLDSIKSKKLQKFSFSINSNLNIDIVSLKWKYIGAKTIKEPFNKNKN